MNIKVRLEDIGYNHNLFFSISQSDIVYDLKKQIFQKSSCIPLNRMGLYYKINGKRIELNSNSSNLKNNLPSTSQLIIYAYDIGITLPINIANVIEYSGPILTFFIFFIYYQWYLQNQCSTITIISFILSTLHYAKRVFESIFVHIHSKTMQLKMLIIECIYYIGYYGIFCGYFIFTNNKKLNYYTDILGIILFFVSEFNNFQCHIILRIIRLKSTIDKKIPKGNLFNYICCANYFWEVCSWISLSVITGLKCVWGFTIIGFLVMTLWGIEKRKGYLILDKENCPKKAIIPFVI